ncbi:MAG: 4Fe-4S binding protein [Capsulimonadaceae bacterium]|nr:4Fe-4S binding protein [Capsulimonadaceae bacterium]
MASERDDKQASRRRFLRDGARLGCAALLAGATGLICGHAAEGETVWQIDPERCTQCGNCSRECVLTPSAVKCVHAFALCGYCRLCFGLLRDKRTGDVAAAEDSRCPVDAIRRRPVEDPYYEISIDEERCLGCARCVMGCAQFGNGSLFIQIRHDRCLDCNECLAALHCPSQAIRRVPASHPYIVKTVRR